ncbi:MAG: aldehyde dehydrogenase, partial [Planctomycetota bacterium]
VERDADVADAVSRIVFGGYYQSGQSCVSVQRVIVHEAVYAELRERLVEAVSALRCGAPRDEDTFIGPVISEAEAERIVSWMESAVAAGARLLTGGTRDGAMVKPAVLEGVPRDQPLWRREVFGPVTVLAPISDFDEALALANDSDYGLQAGVFTRDVYKLMKAWDELEVGGVMANEVPSWRVDHMPYGGVKHSGTGREGIRFAMEKMTEIRLFVLRTP